MQIFRNGKTGPADASDYKGPRDSDGIVQYLEMSSGPASKELTSAAEVKEALIFQHQCPRSSAT